MKSIDLYVVGKKSRSFIKYRGMGRCRFDVAGTVSFPLYPKRVRYIPISHCVLSFEYKASGPIWNTVVSIAAKKRIEYRGIMPSDEWCKAAIDISDYINDIHALIYLSQDLLSLSFIGIPVSSPINFSIRKLCLRERTPSEKKISDKKHEYLEKSNNFRLNLESFRDATLPCTIQSVTCNGSEINVSGCIPIPHISLPFYVSELPMCASFSPNQLMLISEIVPDRVSGCFNVTFDRFIKNEGQSHDRVYSRFFIAVCDDKGLSFASIGKFVTSISSIGGLPEITPMSKKGIGDFRAGLMDSDLDDLGISFVTINIKVNDFFSVNPGEGRSQYEYQGNLFYINDYRIKKYDDAIKTASMRGIIVFAIILITPAYRSDDFETGILLQHPQFDQAGLYSMPDTTNPESLTAYLAALNYLAMRYSRADGLYGNIRRWIVHNEVDSGWIWCNSGKKDLGHYLEDYLRSLRSVWLTVKQYDANAKVYIPLTHNWNLAFAENCFPVVRFMDLLTDYCSLQGDFDWGVAFHLYPQLLWEPRSWLDSQATSNESSLLVTFKNVELLDKWIRSEKMLFDGHTRSLVLSEQNPNSLDYSDKEQSLQAASLCYIWKKVATLDSIEAYIAHCWIDDRSEGGLKTGLRKYADEPFDPLGKKRSWYVYKDLGTVRELSMIEEADKIISRDFDNG